MDDKFQIWVRGILPWRQEQRRREGGAHVLDGFASERQPQKQLSVGGVRGFPHLRQEEVTKTGHGAFVLMVEKAKARTTADPSTSLRSGERIFDLGSWFPALATIRSRKDGA